MGGGGEGGRVLSPYPLFKLPRPNIENYMQKVIYGRIIYILGGRHIKG